MKARGQRYDVVVVGSRVAGATLAALLGRRGLLVLVLDQARFPSDTLSTHVVFDDSFGIWKEAGAWPRIEAIGAVEMPWIDWNRTPPDTDIEGGIRGVSGRDYSLCLRRILLDQALVENAAETPCVEVRTGARVTEVLWDGQRAAGVRYEWRGGGRQRRELAYADLVVGADGRLSFIAEAVGAVAYNVVPPANFPFYTYLVGVEPIDPPAFELYESPELGMIMLTPCDGDIFMGVVYTEQSQYETFRRDHERLFWERFSAEPRLAPRLAQAEQIAPVRGRGDLVNLMRVAAGPGWALVGDSGQHKDPIFGQGIGDAVRTARLLATCVERVAAGELDWDAGLAEFHAYRDADLLPGYDFMIRRRAAGVDREDVELLWREVGGSPEWSERFLNLFTHAVLPAEVLNPESLERFKAELAATRVRVHA
jgi:2-polyprenyl-6-methoxyphenol hydroxylase-like FAD-dependent oxidoreductase